MIYVVPRYRAGNNAGSWQSEPPQRLDVALAGPPPTRRPNASTIAVAKEPHGVANDSDGNVVLLVAVAPNPNR